MGRVELVERQRYPFHVDLRVRVTDLNHAGHLGHDRLLGLAQEARVRLLRRLGAESERRLRDGEVGVVVADAAVVYRGEAFRGDTLRFELAVAELGDKSMRLAHRVRCTGQRTDEVALLELGVLAYDYGRRAVVPWPAWFHAALTSAAA